MNTPLEHANAVWRGEMSPQALAGAIEAYTQELRQHNDQQHLQIGAQAREMEKLRAELETARRERDEARYHEKENAAQAVWFEDALGCKDMPFGTDAHDVAKEKLRDMIARIASLEEQVALSQGSEVILAQCIAGYATQLGLPSDGDTEPPDVAVAIRKLQEREESERAALHQIQDIHIEIRNMLHEAGFLKVIELPTDDGGPSILLREQIEALLAKLSTVEAQCERLRGALEPFARLVNAFDEWREKPEMVAYSHGVILDSQNVPSSVAITFGDLFAAKAALAAPESQKGGE